MSGDVTVYECGLYIDGEYSRFFQSQKEGDVDDHIEIMKEACEVGEIRKFKKLYQCVSTTPIPVEGI